VLGIVIPTLNAAPALARLLDALMPAADGRWGQLLVVDGGSTDDTITIARARGVPVLSTPCGRGRQLAAGCAALAGVDWLLVLHADSIPPPGWDTAVRDFMTDPRNAGRAGYFRFALDDATPAARRLERMVAWRCRVLALPYGDQGLLIPRPLYLAVGGFTPIPLMEDVDLVRRLGRARLAALPLPLTTSAVRFRREGFLRRSARNLCCLSLYLLGVPPDRIAKLYGR